MLVILILEENVRHPAIAQPEVSAAGK